MGNMVVAKQTGLENYAAHSVKVKVAASPRLRKKTMPKFYLTLVLTCLLVSCGIGLPLPGSTHAPASSSQTSVIVTKTQGCSVLPR
jgi:hypothetical protein